MDWDWSRLAVTFLAATTGCRFDSVAVGRAGCVSDVECDDGLTCNGAERCEDGRCTAGPAPACVDDVACTVDSCVEEAGGCMHYPDHAVCPPGQLCDVAAGCAVGASCGTPADCDDGVACNGVEQCVGGLCAPGPVPDCADEIPCTVDSCAWAAAVCVHLPDDAACDDGAACNGAEQCGPAGCVPGPAVVCDDGNPCTADTCTEPDAACASTPVSNGVPEVCDNGQDDDCDGEVDCADASCTGAASCGPVCPATATCVTTSPIGPIGGWYTGSTADGAGADALDYPCGFVGYDGPEHVFLWTEDPTYPWGNGILFFLLGDLTADLDLFVFDAGAASACDPGACLGASRLSGTTTDTVTVPTSGLDAVYVVIDGKGGATGPYSLDAEVMEH